MDRRRSWWLVALVGLLGSAGCGDGLVGSGFTTQLQVYAIEPSEGAPAGGLAVHVTGENFAPDARVFFGAAEAPVTARDGRSRIVVTTPAGEFGPVTVRVAQGAERVEFPTPFRYRAEQVDLAFSEDVGTSGSDAAFAAGDFDGDGRRDLVVATSPSLSIYAGRPQGLVLESALPLPPLGAPDSQECADTLGTPRYSIAVLDYDGDGRDDVLSTGWDTPSLTFYRSGTRREAVRSYPGILDRCRRRELVPVDLDADGRQDLLVVNQEGDATSRPLEPGELGRVGVIFAVGADDERVSILDLGTCDTWHSLWVTRPTPPAALALLCSGGPERLSLVWVDVEGRSGGEPQVSSRVVVEALTRRGPRHHLVDLDGAGPPEVVIVEEGEDGLFGVSRPFAADDPEGGLQPPTERRRLACETTPLLLFPTLLVPGRRDVLALCRTGQLLVAAAADTVPPLYGVDEDYFAAGAGLRAAGAGFAGRRDGALPTAALVDLDGDRFHELLVQDAGPLTRLVWRYSAPVRWMGEDGEEERTRLYFDALPATLPTLGGDVWAPDAAGLYEDGVPTGLLADLDDDGLRDVVLAFEWSEQNAGHTIGIVRHAGAAAGGFGPALTASWPAERGTVVRTLADDLDGDGRRDLAILRNLMATMESGTRAELVVLLAPAGPADPRTFALSPGPLSGVQRVERDRTGGVLHFVAWAPAPDGDPAAVVVSRFEGDLSAGFRLVEERLVALPGPGGVADLVDLDRDGAPDLLTEDGAVCWGAPLPLCAADAVTSLAGESGPVSDVTYFLEPDTDRFQVILVSAGGRGGEWLTLAGREAVERVPGGSLRPHLFATLEPLGRVACDLDGDGRRELVTEIVADPSEELYPGWKGRSFGFLARRADGTAWDYAAPASATFSGEILACLDVQGDGLDDVVLVDLGFAPRVVLNRSR